MKKRNNKQKQYETMGKKIFTGQFAKRLNYNFAVGDQQNNLLVYNLNNQKPLTILNSQTSNVSALTALTFSASQDQIIVGSNRGSINVWDLNTLKISYCLKGHTVEVGSFSVDHNNDKIVASGSYDTNVKIWDMRSKNCLHILKYHSMQVSAIAISPDSRFILSGSEDGTAQYWDMKMLKPVYQYQIDAGVLTLDFHKQRMVFAAGCNDRMARLYQLNSPYNLISTTKNQSMPVVSTQFYNNHFLFTSANQSLKVWDIKKSCVLTDNIQTSSKGILDMIVTTQQTQQLSYTSNILSLFTCRLDTINFKGQYTHIYNPPQSSLNKSEQDKKDNLREQSNRKPIINHLTNNNIKNVIQRRNQSINKVLISGMKQDVNYAINSVKNISDQFAKNRQQSLQLSSMLEEHSKFVNTLTVRTRIIEKILQLWQMGNTKAIISLLKDTQIYVVADVLNQILKPSKFQIGVDFAIVIAQNAKQMMIAKHMTLIKHGLNFLNQIVGLYKQQIIKIKTYPLDKNGVDLAREQRLRKYDKLIDQLMEVYEHPRLKKLLSKKQQLCKLAETLHNQLGFIFKKIFQNQQNF